MQLKICHIKDIGTASSLVEMGVDFLGFHVLEISEAEARVSSARINRDLRAAGYDGGVVLTKAADLAWTVEVAEEGDYPYVQVHRDASLKDIATLAELLHEKDRSLIQVVDPTIHDTRYVRAVLSCADFILYDSYIGGTGRKFNDRDLNGRPMGRAFVAGGVDDIRADQLKARFRPFAVDVQTWVKRDDKSKNFDKVASLLRIAKNDK